MVKISYEFKPRQKVSFKLAKVLVAVIFLNLMNLIVCNFSNLKEVCVFFDLVMLVLNIFAALLLGLIIYFLVVKKEVSTEWK